MKRVTIHRGMIGLVTALMLFFPVSASAADGQAKYVFLFIGDGMGIVQRFAAQAFSGSSLRMNTLPQCAITTTHAADRFITDSAASGTALASGHKTDTGMLGMTPEGTVVSSVAARAREKGMKVGIVTSVSMDHATPAAFYAHVDSRKKAYCIAVDLAKSGFDFFGGGGLMDPENRKTESEIFLGNAFDVIENTGGFTLIRDRKAFLGVSNKALPVYAVNPRLPHQKALPFALEITPEDISLDEFTAKGIELLRDNPHGFFMMVEGGKIDWACHANDAAAALHEVIALDRAVEEAYRFYEAHPEETLIVVTADHECGGMTLGTSAAGTRIQLDLLKRQRVSLQTFALDILQGFQEGEKTFGDMKALVTRYLGLAFTGEPKGDNLVVDSDAAAFLEASFDRVMRDLKEASGEKGWEYGFYKGYDPFINALAEVLSNKAGIGWTSSKHTGVPVMTTAVGAGAYRFSGTLDNTAIAANLLKAMGI